ncbi:MAG TPA: GntR family transcriptional regulator [Acidobacteriaceae bacterium]|nr:GntR family transcriptional regulator [Acidobacteriaceae bacterium]
MPLYSQIEQSLMDKIKKGILSEGEPLQSEQELARLYNVSRMTARQALHGLKQNGYVITVQRKGTFVTTPKIEKTLISLQGFSQEMRGSGMRPSSTVLEHSVITPSEDILERMQLKSGEKVFKLRRLRLADKTPIAVEISYTPVKYFPGIERIDFGRESLYSVLQNRYRVSIGWSEDVIEASKATTEEARLLTIPRGFGILSISRLVMSPEGQPIEACWSRYRSDRYRATIRIPR